MGLLCGEGRGTGEVEGTGDVNAAMRPPGKCVCGVVCTAGGIGGNTGRVGGIGVVNAVVRHRMRGVVCVLLQNARRHWGYWKRYWGVEGIGGDTKCVLLVDVFLTPNTENSPALTFIVVHFPRSVISLVSIFRMAFYNTAYSSCATREGKKSRKYYHQQSGSLR